jgi:hypothetical protein
MATETSSSPMEGAKEQVQEKAQAAQQTARSQMRTQVDQRSTQAGEQLRSSAEALRQTSERLKEQGQDGPAQAAQRLAHQAERAGGYLAESDADRILHDAEEFGRRRPMAVAGLGLFLGFAASRLLKASSRSRYEQRGQQFGGGSQGYGAPGYGSQRGVLAGGTGMTEAGMATAPTQTEPPAVPVTPPVPAGPGAPGGAAGFHEGE